MTDYEKARAKAKVNLVYASDGFSTRGFANAGSLATIAVGKIWQPGEFGDGDGARALAQPLVEKRRGEAANGSSPRAKVNLYSMWAIASVGAASRREATRWGCHRQQSKSQGKSLPAKSLIPYIEPKSNRLAEVGADVGWRWLF